MARVSPGAPPELDPPPGRPQVLSEGNTVAAAGVLIYAVVLDALTSVPTAVQADVPAALRTTAYVLVAFVAAPPVDGRDLFEQRTIATLLLLAPAFLGLHQAELHARLADGVFSALAGYALLSFYVFSGLKPGHRLYDRNGQRENVVALVGALLVYVGLRIVRSGFAHATEVLGFRFAHEEFQIAGLALADDVVAVTSAFGGALVACSGVLILLNHDSVYVFGSEPVGPLAAVMALLVFVSAFVQLLASVGAMDELDALFGDRACVGSAELCAAAYRARRLHFANALGPSAPLMAAAVALTILAYTRERRCDSRVAYFERKVAAAARAEALAEQPADAVAAQQHLAEAYVEMEAELDALLQSASQGSALVAVVGVGVAVAAIWLLADGFRDDWLAGVETLLLFVSIAVAWWGSTALACFLHATGLTLYSTRRLDSPFGFDTAYFTHSSNAVTLALVYLMVLTTGTTQLLFASCCSRRRWVEWIEALTVAALVAVTSIQLFLTLATLGAMAGFEGGTLDGGDTSWAAFSTKWVIQHSVSFFFTAALVGTRYEHHIGSLSAFWMRVLWVAAPVVCVVVWIVGWASSGAESPYAEMTNGAVTALGVVCSLLPWAFVGAVLC